MVVAWAVVVGEVALVVACAVEAEPGERVVALAVVASCVVALGLPALVVARAVEALVVALVALAVA